MPGRSRRGGSSPGWLGRRACPRPGSPGRGPGAARRPRSRWRRRWLLPGSGGTRCRPGRWSRASRWPGWPSSSRWRRPGEPRFNEQAGVGAARIQVDLLGQGHDHGHRVAAAQGPDLVVGGVGEVVRGHPRPLPRRCASPWNGRWRRRAPGRASPGGGHLPPAARPGAPGNPRPRSTDRGIRRCPAAAPPAGSGPGCSARRLPDSCRPGVRTRRPCRCRPGPWACARADSRSSRSSRSSCSHV